ncbi:T9SS type A sorting domain-containing protein [Dysgonomonas sp. 520]|uniref:T9SS type A sorting domain-containing protein n=1 Tax=Dysgonomonas sp. 520 TaxID=2302931 RepID=UPI0013D59087|nr:T9SS type A sorting domain-containing protein [Dysgonomonas sp. 520]NDW11008.1 T9SS C-terminal target domain-containing protein [Dysgonomonas sp. 520]
MRRLFSLLCLHIFTSTFLWGQVGEYEVKFLFTEIKVHADISGNCNSHITTKLRFQSGEEVSFFRQGTDHTDMALLPSSHTYTFSANKTLRDMWVYTSGVKHHGGIFGKGCTEDHKRQYYVSLPYGYTEGATGKNDPANPFGTHYGYEGYQSLLPKLKINNPNINNFLPTEDKVLISSHTGFKPSEYNWQYATRRDSTWYKPMFGTGHWRYFYNWVDLPQYNGQSSINITAKDILGTDADNHIGKNIFFRQVAYNNKATSSVVSYNIMLSSPGITSVSYQLPDCHNGDDAKLFIHFDRELYDRENLYISTNENSFKYKLLAQPGSKIMEIPGLLADTFNISLLGTYRFGTNVNDTVNTYTDGVRHKYSIRIPNRPAISLDDISQDPVHCYGGRDGKIHVRAGGGTGEFDALLYKGGVYQDSIRFIASNTGEFKELDKGTYQVFIQDTNGCTMDASMNPVVGNITVLEPTEKVTITGSSSQEPKGFGLSDGKAQITFTGGTSGSYTVVWKDSLNKVIPNTITPDGVSFISKVENIPSGRYNIIVQDVNYNSATPQTEENFCGCADTTSLFVDEPPMLGAVIEQHRYVTCYGDKDGQIVAHAKGGRPNLTGLPYAYQWEKIEGANIIPITQTDSIATELYSGYYRVKITDSNGISAYSETFHLTQPELLTVSTGVLQHNTCGGDADGIIEATPSGGVPPYTYLWSTGDTTRVVSGLRQGRYTVEVRDSRFSGSIFDPYCFAQASDSVTSPDYVSITVAIEDAHCYGGRDGKIKVNATGGNDIYDALLFQNGVQLDSIRFAITDTAIFEELSAGAYNVRVDDVYGCAGPDTLVTVSEPVNEVSISGYKWEEPKGFGLSDGWAEITFNGGTATSYTVIWKDSLDNIIPNTITQDGGIFTSKVQNIPSSTYFVTVQDANYPLANPRTEENLCGCTDTISFFVEEPPKLEVYVEEHRYVTCHGDKDGQIVAHATGGRPHENQSLPYTYQWEKVEGQATVPETQTDSLITELYSGYYRVKITDRNNIFTYSDDYYLVQPDPLVVTTKVLQNTQCSGDSIGIIEATASGGTPPYTYIWSTNDSTRTVYGLPQGYYVVGVRDARYQENMMGHYCFAQANDSIMSPNSIRLNASVKHPVCNGYANGEIRLNVTGGVQPYSYLWEDGSTLALRSNLPEGEYRVRVTDTNGCFMQETYTLTQPDPVVVELEDDFVLCKGQSKTISGNANFENVSYKWTNATGNVVSETESLNINKAGTYTLTATTPEGCYGSDDITVEESDDVVTPDFVIASRVANNTQVYAVNLTLTPSDSIKWIIPEDVSILEESQDRVALSFPENGEYIIGMAVYKNMCSDMLYKTVSVVDPEDVGEDGSQEPFLKRFIVSPNPNNGEFRVIVELREQADYQLYLFDMSGKLVERKEIKGGINEATLFSRTGVASGTYFLRFVSSQATSVFNILIE